MSAKAASLPAGELGRSYKTIRFQLTAARVRQASLVQFAQYVTEFLAAVGMQKPGLAPAPERSSMDGTEESVG